MKAIGKALRVKPDFAQGHLDLGNLHARAGRYKEAGASFRAALRLDPALLDAHHNLGNTLQELGQHEDALSCYDAVLAHDREHAPSYFNRGNALKALGRFAEAVVAYEAALARQPDFVPALNNLGLVLLKLGRADESLVRFQRALVLRPDHPEYLNNTGLALDELNQLDSALVVLDRALELRPDYVEAWYNRGITLKKQKKWDDALVSYQQAIQLNPAYSDALWNRSLVRLLSGDFARGWDGFEQRWERPHARVTKKCFAPEWDGKKFGGTLLVLNEQGVGDEIFYSAMLNELRPYAASITVCVDPRLVELFRRSFNGITVMSRADLVPGATFDAQVYMASLGQYFRTSSESFGHIKSPYLWADAARARALRAKIGAEKKRVCGLSWFSKNATIGAEKSLRLMDLVPILQAPGLAFVDLQYGDTTKEQDALQAATGLRLTRVPEIDNFNDIDGLAALIDACDIVVTVSNTTAHLAAALGKPVLVMLSYSPGLLWYWHLDRTNSPWYPSVRLFRQSRPGDWGEVVARLGEIITPK